MTINGKEISETFKELLKPFSPGDYKLSYGGFPYLPYAIVKHRFDDILGVHNYDLCFEQLNIVESREAENITVLCKIRIKDDSGKIIIDRSAYGSFEVFYPNDDKNNNNESGSNCKTMNLNRPVNFRNNLNSAQKDAFKQCADMIFEELDGAENVSLKKDNEYELLITSSLSEMKGYKNAYKGSALLENNEIEVVFWNSFVEKMIKDNQWDDIKNKFNNNHLIKVAGSKKLFGGKTQISVDNIL